MNHSWHQGGRLVKVAATLLDKWFTFLPWARSIWRAVACVAGVNGKGVGDAKKRGIREQPLLGLRLLSPRPPKTPWSAEKRWDSRHWLKILETYWIPGIYHLTGEISLNTHKQWYRAFIDINDYAAVLIRARLILTPLADTGGFWLHRQYHGLPAKAVWKDLKGNSCCYFTNELVSFLRKRQKWCLRDLFDFDSRRVQIFACFMIRNIFEIHRTVHLTYRLSLV